jgi:hypothetical protein
MTVPALDNTKEKSWDWMNKPILDDGAATILAVLIPLEVAIAVYWVLVG